MSSSTIKNHVIMPPNTIAYKCANCGAVSLDHSTICSLQGRVKKGDWCGSASIDMSSMCVNAKNNERYKCAKCGRIAMTPNLLCEPEKVPAPK